MNQELEKKIQKAVRLIRLSAPENGDPVEVAYSGGKDSDVILQLTKEAGINYRAIYKNTTIDPPGTLKHAREMGAEVRMPEKSFFQLIEMWGYPTRFSRFCCRYLKEYKVLDKAIMGIRRSESTKRASRYKEPTECRFYGSKKDHIEAIYPILDWTDSDVKEYLLDRNIKVAPVYYDQDGNFQVERRLGCIGCPLASKKHRINEFRKYPNMVKAYIRSGQRYMNNHPQSRIVKWYKDAFEWFVRDVFFETQISFDEYCNGMFGKPDFKAFLEKEFNIKFDTK